MRAAGAAGRSQQDLVRQRVAAGLAVPGKALRVFEVREPRDGGAAEQEPAACGHLAVSIAGSSARSQGQHALVDHSLQWCECHRVHGVLIHRCGSCLLRMRREWCRIILHNTAQSPCMQPHALLKTSLCTC